MPPPPSIDAGVAGPALAPARTLPIPRYLEQVYWWAYVHPNAVQVFEREWLVNLILFGNYGRLRDAALDDLGATVRGRTLQVACAYGNLTPRLRDAPGPRREAGRGGHPADPAAEPGEKLPADERIALHAGRLLVAGHARTRATTRCCCSSCCTSSPRRVRRNTLAEAMRVVKPGGKIVIVDYHRPAARGIRCAC